MSEAQPLVSIVLPTYNGAKYLPEAIESCLSQTYAAWELIVVDDCSTDSTPGIIAEYAAHDGRIRGIRHRKNLKLPGALNTGHAAAKGSYLSWTSDDNRFLPAAFEEMVRFLEQHPAIGLVYADSVAIDEAGNYLRDAPAEPASRLAYFNALGACFLYRRRVYQVIGAYDADLFLAEDYDYWLRVHRQFEIAHLPRVLYQYRFHGDSLTSTHPAAAVRNTVERILRRHLPYLRRSTAHDRARGWMVCAGAAARRLAPLRAVDALGRALLTSPLFSVAYGAKRFVRLLREIGRPPRP